jgi:hypothetical protein
VDDEHVERQAGDVHARRVGGPRSPLEASIALLRSLSDRSWVHLREPVDRRGPGSGPFAGIP